MTRVYLNHIATAVPAHDVHQAFTDYVPSLLESDRDRRMFAQLVRRAHIAHRYSFLKPSPSPAQLDGDDFYKPGHFPGTAKRMQFYKDHAFTLVCEALDQLDIAAFKDDITHVIVTSCTGFYAPGIDWQIVQHYGLNWSVERTIIGFMGCQAAINALKLAQHIVRSKPAAKVLVVNIELCTLHMQETAELEEVLSFLLFADGCAASIISADATGLEIQKFSSAVMPDSSDQITWHIGQGGFEMVLSRHVPATIAKGLGDGLPQILHGHDRAEVQHWAVHPGGSGILDAVQNSLGLHAKALDCSRKILREFGNMSSATIMFVLKALMDSKPLTGLGCALAFGPGLTAESMLFGV